MTTAERIKQRRKDLGLRAEDVAESVDYLMGWTEDEKEPIPMDEDRLDQEFVRLFEQLGNDQKDLIVRAMKGILSEK